jgi:hypothetical protein
MPNAWIGDDGVSGVTDSFRFIDDMKQANERGFAGRHQKTRMASRSTSDRMNFDRPVRVP